MAQFKCTCGLVQTVKNELIGKKARCPRCKTVVEVFGDEQSPGAKVTRGAQSPPAHDLRSAKTPAVKQAPPASDYPTFERAQPAKSKMPVLLIGGGAVFVVALAIGVVVMLLVVSKKNGEKPVADPVAHAGLPVTPAKAVAPPQTTTTQTAPDDVAARELARLRAENDRLKALVTSPPKPMPTPVSKPAEVAYGKVSGAAWTVKNDGTSNLLRGIPIVIFEKQTNEIPKLLEFLKAQKAQFKADVSILHESADELQKQEYAEKKEVDEALNNAVSAADQVPTVQKMIDKLSATSSIDRLQAFKIEKQFADSLKVTANEKWLLSIRLRGDTSPAHQPATPEVLVGDGPSGKAVRSAKTNVDGKFVTDKVPPGDYYLISCFGSATFFIQWIVPIHVEGNKETTVDLDNDNAVFIRQVSAGPVE